MSKDLELALRIKADLDQGRQELVQFTGALNQTGEAADAAGAKLTRAGETADQQAARIQAMVQASLANASAQDDARVSLEGLTQTQSRANSTWQQAAAAQDKAMQATSAAATKTAQSEQALASASGKAAGGMKQGAAAADKQSQELTELLGRIDPVVRELDRLDAMERQLTNARRTGRIDVDTYDLYNAKLAENRNRLTASTAAMGGATISAGQYKQAMRQLPMQITDVTTSLVSGMPIWMVAVQQGGQIKDSFGGIGPAARAVVGAINPMTLAIGAAVATVGALVIAHEQGAGEARKYREALIMSGNAAGTSSDQLGAMAERIDDVAGTQRQAAAALSAAARTGKIAGDQLEQVAQTAVELQVAMGKSVQETVDEYVELGKDPVTAIARLNDKYNFLTAAVFEQIIALKDQGDEAGAARLAMDTYSATMQTRSSEIVENLGYIETAWRAIKRGAAEAWDAMLNVGREQSLEEQLKIVERTIRLRDSNATPNPMAFRVRTKEDDELAARREGLIAAIKQRDIDSQAAGEQAKTQGAAADAVEYLNKLREDGLTREEKKTKAIAEYWREIEALRAGNPDSELLSEDSIARGLANIETKFAPPKTRTATNTDAAAAERWVAQLEREAATYGKDRSELKKYELGLMDLSAAQRARAETANAALATAEAQAKADKQAAQDTKLLAQLQLDYLKATGQAVEAAEAEIEKKYGELRDRLLASGNEDGANLVSKLIGLETAQAQLNQFEQQISQMFAATSRQEQSVRAQLETGLITEGEARRRIVELHQQQATEVEKLLPLMQELAVATGDPAALENVERIRAELESMQVISNELAISFRDGLQGGLEEAIMGLAEGTMSLRDALDSLVLGIADSMAKMASEGLAELATQGVMDLFAKGAQAAIAAAGQKAAAEVAAIGTVTAAKTAADTTMAASSVASANAAAAGQATAAATTTTAWAPAATTASIGSFGAAAAIGIAAVVAALAMSQSFNTGGKVRGEGTGTSDSIRAWLSNGEFVTRAAVMSQPGAEAFAEDFNQRGMVALEDWTGAARQATGGLAGVPAPAAPAPAMNNGRLADPAAVKQNTTLKNAVNLYAVQNPADIASMAWGREGEEHFEVYLQKNGARVRQLMGIN